MKVTLEDYTENPEFKIAKYAAICYDADTTSQACERRMRKLLSLGHLSTLRFAYAVFKVEGVSRTCTHQLVRHPHLSYLQESQRYVKQKDSIMIMPDNMSKDLQQKWEDHFKRSKHLYTASLTELNKGDARFILPQGVASSMYISGNFQAWYDFLGSRLSKAAQWEVREVASEIRDCLVEIAPNIFGGFETKS